MKEEPDVEKEAQKASEVGEQVSSSVESSVQDEASTDEVKVYKDEGEEEESRSSENLSEEKLGLVIESEEGKISDVEGRSDFTADENSCGQKHAAKIQKCSFFDRLPFGYPLLPPYHPYSSSGPSLMGELFPAAAGLGLYMYNDNPPPAHMGIQPLHIDPKTGLPRTPFYGLSTSPVHPTIYNPEMSQMHSLDLVSRTSPVSSLCGSYSTNISPPSLAWLGASGILPPPPPPHPGFPYHEFNSPQPLVASSSLKQELSPQTESDDTRDSRLSSSSSNQHFNSNHQRFAGQQDKKRPYVKKPLNAYMLFMKEMRQSVIEECTLKESAAINQILGRKWHALDKAEQQKYYDMAKREKELHLQMYPGWSARDNYATHTKKKKRKKEPTSVLLSSQTESPRMRRTSDQFQNHANGANKISLYNQRTIFDRHFEPFAPNNCNSDHSNAADETNQI